MSADAELTTEDCSTIIESLNYTIQKFRDYGGYPDETFRRSQIARVEATRDRVRALSARLSGS
jgi:hypothetical protein